jgi:ketosteroid isomerase-like protein
MPRTLFPTPEDAEQAFYEAAEAGDVDALMAVWAEDDEVVCVHPNGERLVGQAAIRDSWRKILSSGRKLQVRLEQPVRWQGLMLATHSAIETVLIDGESETLQLACTNVFVRTATGWRMLVHHASPMSSQSGSPQGGSQPPILH